MSVKVSTPTTQLVADNRVVNGIIVLPEGVTPETVNPETDVCRIMFEESATTLGGIGGGFNNGARKRTYFESGYLPALQSLVSDPAYKLAANKVIPGVKIIVQESTSPFYANQQPKIYPESSPYAGEEITSLGAVVYRRTQLVPIAGIYSDVLLPTDSKNQPMPSANDDIEEVAVEADFTRDQASA